MQKSLVELRGEGGEEIDACKLCVCVAGECLSKMPGGSAAETACASCPPQQEERGAAQKNPGLGFDVAGGGVGRASSDCCLDYQPI